MTEGEVKEIYVAEVPDGNAWVSQLVDAELCFGRICGIAEVHIRDQQNRNVNRVSRCHRWWKIVLDGAVKVLIPVPLCRVEL